MEKLCADICGGICIFIIACIVIAVASFCYDAHKKGKKQEEENKRKAGELLNDAESVKKDCERALSKCFEQKQHAYAQTIKDIQSSLSRLEKIDKDIRVRTREYSQEYAITGYRKKCEELGGLQQRTEQFEEKNRQYAGYGKIEKDYLAEVRKLSSEHAVAFVQGCEDIIRSRDIAALCEVNLDRLLKCVWLFAAAEPFDQAVYDKAVRVYSSLCKKNPLKVRELIDSIEEKKRNIETALGRIDKDIVSYLLHGNHIYKMENPYALPWEYDVRMYKDVEKTIQEAEKTNQEVMSLSELETISPMLGRAKKSRDAYFSIMSKRKSYKPASIVEAPLLSPSYGKVNAKFWDEINTMDRENAEKNRHQWHTWIYEDRDVVRLATVDFDEVLKTVWYYAIAKPFSANEYSMVVNIFRALAVDTSALDSGILISELYSLNAIGGDSAVTKRVSAYVEGEEDGIPLKSYNAYYFAELASALMWMQAYQAEHIVLKTMLDNQMEMSQKMQERLHAFSKGQGDAPKILSVEPNSNEVHIEVSSLAWNDEGYEGLFENLAFQEKTLSYALAIRDEDASLLLGQKVGQRGLEEFCDRIKEVFLEEFGSSASVKIADCLLLSGNVQEATRGILAQSAECPQLGLGMFINHIGKKLNIKFYTLLMPTGTQVSEQKQQAISMFRKMSPMVTTWESSLKDSMLIGVQQMLNVGTQPGGSEEVSTLPTVETIF